MHAMTCDVALSGRLNDGCDGCLAIATAPIRNADNTVLRSLIERAIDREIVPRTGAEAIGAKNILDTLERFGRIAEAEPGLALGYLYDRWNVAVAV
jgi:hypothetical protein